MSKLGPPPSLHFVSGNVSRPLGISLLGKALQKNLWSLEVRDIRDHGLGKHRTVDDTPPAAGRAW